MVQHDGDLFGVEHAGETGLVKGGHCHGGGDVVAQNQIQLGFNQVTGLDSGQTGVSGQDLLCHCHSHNY